MARQYLKRRQRERLKKLESSCLEVQRHIRGYQTRCKYHRKLSQLQRTYAERSLNRLVTKAYRGYRYSRKLARKRRVQREASDWSSTQWQANYQSLLATFPDESKGGDVFNPQLQENDKRQEAGAFVKYLQQPKLKKAVAMIERAWFLRKKRQIDTTSGSTSEQRPNEGQSRIEDIFATTSGSHLSPGIAAGWPT